MKLCAGICQENKSRDLFSKDSNTKDGYRHDCNECRAKKRRAHSLKDLSKSSARRRKHRLKSIYGITMEQYDQRYIEQLGKCKICRTHQSELKKRLEVDHDHATGLVRGLLCPKCNKALGLLNDNSEVLVSAIKYLKG